MEIRMLMPKDAESKRLVEWVEGGERTPLTAARQ